MSDTTQAELRQLKYELKLWERSFASANDGRKATKADIKADTVIAAKYRQYSQLSRPKDQTRHSPRKSQHVVGGQTEERVAKQQIGTPSKSRIISMSPRKTPGNTEKHAALSPTPQALRMRLGPTPQKDGQILSLFEMSFGGTPSRPRTALGDMDTNVAATPSKTQTDSGLEIEDTENARPSRTPTSSGKRYMLDTFATPMKRKREEIAHTPSSNREVHATPQFLRRTNVLFGSKLGTVDEGDDSVVNRAQPPFKKRSLARSLSSIIRGLKAQEDDKADEDLDLLRELEGDMFESVSNDKVRSVPVKDRDPPTEKVLETQVEMPLGPDALPLSDEEINDVGSLDANGQPRKVWKKKGLKRQTKRVKMRPRPQAKPAAVHTTDLMEFSSVKDDQSEHEAMPEGSDSEFSESEVKPVSKPTKKAGPTSGGNDAETDKTKKTKKVSATAHANFCRLKIKNKNSKANGRGRFGRR
ncbi:DNA replication/checkpoint protein [Elsinoe ampelina]|uniref:DNA replication regulator SLD2 n=1 Tax=Elsinoe ampelina TaxID=302913 RepID=A0A6A6FYI9_9PEZI|nr:DNA replication/checkpoint protein [Elsinoe ampelina]